MQDSITGGKTRHGSIGGFWFEVDVGVKPRINYVASQTDREAARRGLDFAELAGEVAGRARDGGDAERGSVPEEGIVELSDGDVEAVSQLLFQRAHRLAAVFERLCVLNGEFEGEGAERHVCQGKRAKSES